MRQRYTLKACTPSCITSACADSTSWFTSCSRTPTETGIPMPPEEPKGGIIEAKWRNTALIGNLGILQYAHHRQYRSALSSIGR